MDYPYLTPSEVPLDLAKQVFSGPGRYPTTPAAIFKRVKRIFGDGPYPPACRPPQEEAARIAMKGISMVQEAVKDKAFREFLRVLIWEEENRQRDLADERKRRKAEVPAPPPAPAGVSRGLLGGRRVVDHPELAQVVGADQDLVEGGVVVDRVHVRPVGVRPPREVEIHQLGMVGDDPVVGLRRVEVLDEVFPEVPLPDDRAGRGAGRLHLDDVVRPEALRGHEGGVPPGGDRLGARLQLPGDEQQVAVGEPLGVVVLEVEVGRVDVVPRDVPSQSISCTRPPEPPAVKTGFCTIAVRSRRPFSMR